MNDFSTLTDAFTELERRADAAGVGDFEPVGAQPARRRTHRVMLVGATAAVVGAASVGAVLVSTNGGSSSPAGAPGTASAPVSTSVAPTASTSGPARFVIPQTMAALSDRFRAVLDGQATFTVDPTYSIDAPAANGTGSAPSVVVTGPSGSTKTIPTSGADSGNGAFIVGVLTANGVSGGYDLQIDQMSPDEQPWCAAGSACTPQQLADGSWLTHSTMTLEGGGVTNEVILHHPDGVEWIFHVSSRQNPKGAGAALAATPPLTVDRMIAIVTSTRW